MLCIMNAKTKKANTKKKSGTKKALKAEAAKQRNLWPRSPITRTTDNKKALQSKTACRASWS